MVERASAWEDADDEMKAIRPGRNRPRRVRVGGTVGPGEGVVINNAIHINGGTFTTAGEH